MTHEPNTDPEEALDMDEDVRDQLGLDPAALATLAGKRPGRHAVAAGSISRVGLNILLRRSLTLYLALLPDEAAVLRLETEESAKAAGWPDARTANYALVLTWALFSDDRRMMGAPMVPLLKAGAAAVSPAQLHPPADLEPASALARKIGMPIVVSGKKIVRGDALWANPDPVPDAVASPNEPVRAILGLDPLVLAKAVPGLRNKPISLLDEDAELAGQVGMQKFMFDVLTQYRTMETRRTEDVRLMGEHDAADVGRPDAHSANVSMLLSVGLMSEGSWEVQVFQARERSQAREDLLKAMAREVVLSQSINAADGFRMMCDGMTHFGVPANGRLGTQLIEAAYMEAKKRRAK